MTQPPMSGPAPDPYGQQPSGPTQNPYGQQPTGPTQNPYGQQPMPQAGPPQQQGGPQAPQGQPPAQPGPAGPMGTVALTIQGSVMTSSMITPSIKINGHQIQTRYGRQDVPVPAGPVHIEGYAQWMRTYGQAAMDFTVEPGQTVPVFYAAPLHQFTTGSIGHEQQKRKGVGFLVGLIVIVVAFIVMMIVFGALLS